MKFRMKLWTIALCLIMVFSIQVFGEIDHIRFGSVDTPLKGVTVTWRTNHNMCDFKWGYSTEYEKSKEPPGPSIEGRIEFGDKNFYLFDYTFPDLDGSKTVHFSIREFNEKYECTPYSGEWSQDYTFQTASGAPGNKFTFIAGGDSATEMCDTTMPGWQLTSEKLKDTTADFYIDCGDLFVEGGDKAKCNLWFDTGKNVLSQKLFYYATGNHDTYGDRTLTNILNQFITPTNGNNTNLYYSFEYGNAVFIFLTVEFIPGRDSDKDFIKKQTDWLTLQLKKYRTRGSRNYKEWVIISFHKPFFTIDKHEGEMTSVKPNAETSGDYSKVWWKNLFDKYGVDVIINGHTHLYMRSVPLLLDGTGPGGKDITFDKEGIPSTPAKIVRYGNRKDEGRLEIITGGFGSILRTENKLPYKNQWYVAKDKDGKPLYVLAFHYCTFNIDGKKLEMIARKTDDNSIIDQLTIEHK